MKKPEDVKLTCLSIDCPERFSNCCGKISTLGKEEGTFVCSGCGKRFESPACEADKDNTMKNLTAEALTFLYESNAIEDVHDADSLRQAIYAWEYLIEQHTLDIGVILKTHKILMLHQKLQPDQKGYLRTIPVYIGGHEAMKAYAIRGALENWCIDVKEQFSWVVDGTDTIADEIMQKHIRYEAIHPFVDGNGRTGRMFMNWQRVKHGLPILTFYNAEKYEKYYPLFEK